MTNKPKGTPGPWSYLPPLGEGLHAVLSDKVNEGGNFYVAQCNRAEDARLIAAAPAMREALREAEEIIGDSVPTWATVARAALRLADGECEHQRTEAL